MVTSTYLRVLRMKYHIPLKAISHKAMLSFQYLNLLELASAKPSAEAKAAIEQALEEIVQERIRNAQNLHEQFQLYRKELLTPVEVDADEQ